MLSFESVALRARGIIAPAALGLFVAIFVFPGPLPGVLFSPQAHAHGVVGQRKFIEPFVTEDVNPKDEFVVARPEWDNSREGHVLSYGFGLEKKLSDDLSITLDSEWLRISPSDPDEPNKSGFNSLGISLKYAFFKSPDREAIASFAVEAGAPTGTADVGAEEDWAFRPFFLYGKGFGDLPDGLEYLRPFAVQGDFGPEVSAGPGTAMAFAHNICLQYSILYLQAVVKDLGLGWPFNSLVAVTEFNFEHGLRGEKKGINNITTTPGIVYMGRYVELGVAGRFPLTGSAHDELDSGVIFIVDLFLDDILPASNRQLF